MTKQFKFSLTSILLCFLFSFLYSEEWVKNDTVEVREITMSDVEWTQPRDGTKPEIIKWNLKVLLDNGQELFTTSKEQDSTTDLYTFFNRGDYVMLIKRSFFLNDPRESWFQVTNLSTNRTSILKGPSRSQAKPFLEEENVFYVNHPILSQDSNGKWLISFHIKDIYTQVEVESDKFHDFYEGMPLKYIGISDLEYDTFGKRRSKLYFYHPTKEQEIELTSNWSGGPTTFTIDKVHAPEHYYYHWHGERITYRDYIITLSDGTELFFGGKDFGGQYGLFQEGDVLILLNEMILKTSEEFKRFKGIFLTRNQRTGRDYYLQGTIRFLDEYKAWDPFTIAKSITDNKVWEDAGDRNDKVFRALLKWKTTIELNDGRRFYFDGTPDIGKFSLVRNPYAFPREYWEAPSPDSIFMEGDPIALLYMEGQKYLIRNIRTGKEYWFNLIDPYPLPS